MHLLATARHDTIFEMENIFWFQIGHLSPQITHQLNWTFPYKELPLG